MSPALPPLPEDADPALGTVLRRLREERGLSRADLAGRAGIDEAYLAKIEAATTDPPWAAVEALAHGLGVSTESIATDVVAQDQDKP